ncbi:MAG: DUF11 domain-containing protein [Actinobacteria bacterium]|nr:DUF11 domain-containing protein [Actinomycetota bacterium]
MLKERGVSWVLALAMALVGAVVVEPTTASAATTITVSAAQDVQAQLALHYGSTASSANSGTANYQAGDCLRLGSETGTATTGVLSNTGGTAITSATTGNTAYVSSGSMVWAGHGTSNTNGRTCVNDNLSLTAQSALGFAPVAVGSFTPGGIFNLGKMAHKNTGIYLNSGNQYFRGNLNLQFMGMTLSYTYEMNETTGSGVADTTTFLNQVGNQTFTYNGLSYTLIIRGFTAPQTGTTCNATVSSLSGVTTVFTTAENATTYGCLYAQIQQTRPLTIVKRALAPYGAPTSYPAFSYTASSDLAGSPWGSAFTLTPTAAGAAGQATRTADLVSGQTVNIAETAPTSSGWAFTSLSCVDGAGSSSISGLTVSGAGIALSGDYGTTSATAAPITCTYTNTYTPRATLTLAKQVTTTGQSGTLAVPADWTLSATGTGTVAGQSVSGASGSAAVTSASVIAGTYTLSEVGSNSATTAGYVQDGSWSCSAGTLSGNTLTLAAGQSATCTVKNKFAVGKLAITKTVTGNGYSGGASKAFTAAYTCTSGTTTVKSGTVTVYPNATNGSAGAAVTVDGVPAGANCTVTESGAPTGTSTGLVNSSWVWGTPVNPAVVTIAADATSTVNITNPTTQQLGSFQIVKAIAPRSGVPGAGYSGGATRTFPITYTCTLGGSTVSSGTVDVSTGTSTTIAGIPASSTCSVTGEDQAARTGDFLDASYGWDGYTASAAVTVTANATSTVTVTNYFRRDLVTLNLAKVVTGNGYSGTGADFTIAYDCGAPYVGTVSVAAGGSQSVTVPAGVACTVTEQAPASTLLKGGYVWGDPTYTGLTNGSIAVPKGGTGTVTVTNPTSIGYGRVQVTKAVASHAAQVTSGTVFKVRVSCDAAAQGTTGDYSDTFSLVWPSAVTALTPYLPVGTSCTVTETDAPTGSTALPNASYAWKAAPDAVTVTVPATEDAKSVTVTNDVKRVTATFTVAKDIVNHTGHGTSGYHFSGSYRCDYNNGEDVRSGSWGVTGQGTAASVDVLVGSVCTVTEDTPGAPVDGDRSYTWSTQTPVPTTVGTDGATATVVNTLNRAEGSFNVTKSVQGGTAGTAFATGADFGFSYTCTPLTGDPITGSFTVNAGDSKAPGDAIPGGSTCTVTEGDFPGAIDPYRWDDVALSVSGDASNTGQSGRSITFTTTDDAQPVSVRATNSISAKTASVTVTKSVTGETAGYDGGPVFPVTLTCSTGAQGTKNVAAGSSVTWDGIPLGSTCSAAEGSTTGGLVDGSYAWGEPTIGDAVTLNDTRTYEIAIKNPIRRVYAGIEIAKVVKVGTFSGVADPTQEFTGTWSCTYGNDSPVTGTWQGQGGEAGTLATLSDGADHLLVGSTCTVTEDTAFGAPSADPSYRWDSTPAYDGAVVKAGESNRLTVTNKLLRDTGKVTVGKELTGETAGYAPSGGFAGFSVTARCYLNDPDENGRLEATVAVKPGDEATVIDGVPYGWTCAVSEGSFPTPSQLRDASYAWDSQAVAFSGGGATTTVTAGNQSPHATVTNGIRRVTGHLSITKAFGDGTAEAVLDGTTFSGGYRCTYGERTYTGTWTVDGTGVATLSGDSDIPFTADCTATENDPSDSALVDSSYTWSKPDLGGTVSIASASEPAQLVVTNTAGRRWSGLEITKAYDGPAGAFASSLQVSGTWSCTYRGQVAGSGSWTLPAGGGSVVVARPSDTAIPAASQCTVAENSLAADQLTDASFAWGPVTYSAADGTVTTTADDTATVTVTNSTTRVKASFTVAKQYQLGNGVEASALESDLTFSGRYRCTHTGDAAVTGDWGPVSAGSEWTSPAVLVGSACTVTSEDDRDAPSKADASYLWGDPDLGSPITVVPADQVRPAITVTNPVTRVTGSFGVTKLVTGDTEGIAPSTQYDFSWTCVAANGNTFPANAPGTFSLGAGSTWNAPDDVPVGSDCRVTEGAAPNASDPSYAWDTSFDVVNATGTTSGRTVRFTLPRGNAPVSVTATNHLTRTKGSFTIAKSANPADGATVVPGQAIHYTVTVTPAQIGFTRNVVVTDALAGVLAHADVTDIAVSQGSAILSGTDLVWTVGTVKAGTALTLTYTATVTADANGADLTNTVSATGETPPTACGAACTTVHHTPAWTLSKTSDPASGATVAPGDTITYTLTATNTANAQVTGATATDDLTGLADADVTFTSTQLSRTGNTLTWAIPAMAKGETKTVTYTATVKAGADGATLRNTVTPHGAGATCDGGCSTTQSTVKWTLAKTSSPASGSVVAPGDVITYTLTVTNTGPTTVPAAKVSDDISDVVDDATLGTLPSGVTRSGNTLTWTAPSLAPGASASVDYTATVKAGALGATLRNTASPASTGGHCDGSCTTAATTPKWTLAKTSSAAAGATVRPGDVVDYTLTVTNTGPAVLHGASVTDNLADVLDDAPLVAVPAGAIVTGGTLTWAVPDVAAGGTATLTYQVKVVADGGTLHNVAAPASPGGTCTTCATTAYTPSWTLTKASDPASGGTVAVGDTITYTLTATNTGPGVVAGATGTDNLASVLANADVAFTSPQLGLSGTTLTWTIPTLQPGEHASVTYTATVKTTGVTVTNSVTANGAGGTCVGCTTNSATAKWSLNKTSTPASGAVVEPGDILTYTLTVVNEGPVPVTGASVTDDLSNVLDDADLGALPAGLSRSGNTLTWALPTVPVGGIASISYQATVRAGASGATITNVATPVGAGGYCALTCTTTAHTDGWTLTKDSTPGDGSSVQPGDTVSWRLTVQNTGGTILHGALVTDDLTDVLDDAVLDALPAGASVTGNTLTWSVPDVAAGASTTLTYSGTVKAGALGVRLRNVASPASTGGICGARCSTTQYTGQWTLAKSSSPASGVVKPGDVITWTLTAHNSSQATVAGATATDGLTSVLANADVTATSPQLSLSGNTLTWSIPAMAPGETKTVTYSATVKAGAEGATLTNTVVPGGSGGACTTCSTTHTTPKWTLAKTSTPASGTVVKTGDVVSYTLTVTNTGPATLTGATATDDVSGLVDDATLGTLPSGLTRSGNTLTWAVPDVAAGATATVTYTATVKGGAHGATLTNTAAPTSPGGTCTTCGTTSWTPSWDLAKTSDAGAVVHPGDVITYTLTVTNTGPAPLTGASLTDDLSDVLDDATLVALPSGTTLAADRLTWPVPTVAPGASASLSYQVTVVKDGATLRNTATPVGDGGRCPTSCTTTSATPAWTQAKASDPASGSTVTAGDTITYTLTATNTSGVPVTGATATDDLTSVLAAADVTTTGTELSRTGTTLTWTIPTLAPGQTRTVTYTAKVRATGAVLTNTVAPHGQGGTCGAGCSTTAYTAQWSLAKSTDAGTVVTPGQVVHYTLTVTNTGPVALTGASVRDDVSGLVDDATLGTLPAGLTRSGNTLTWAVPDVAVGGTASITYAATVKADSLGATLTNTASAASAGGSCGTSCTTTQYTPSWTLAKSSSVGPGDTVTPGDTVDYTLTVTNTGPATLSGASVRDDLAAVLDDADLGTVPAGATVTGDVLTWAVPDVAPGASTSLTYRVTVKATAVGATLTNTAAPDSVGGRCATASGCSTTAYTPSWTLAKTSSPASGAVVKPGDVITYTLTATNTSDAQIRGALALDDLSKVLPYADVTFTSGQLSRTGDILTWTIPTLAKSEHAEVTYTATVKAGADGVTVVNSVSPVGAGGSCVGGCATTQSTGAWTLAKASDAGAQVVPGQAIHYTLTVTNTGPVALSGALVSDDLSEVLDDATVSDLGQGLTRSGATLVWAVPDVPVGGHVSVGYTVVVAAGSTGDTLTNTASPVTSGGRCDVCTTSSSTPSWTLAKTSDPADGATVGPGSTISYTLTVTNTGPATLSSASVSDDVSGLVASADLQALPAGLTRTGDTLTWAVPDVAPGTTASVTYAAVVKTSATGATLRNAATPTTVGGTCADDCSTTAHTGAWTLQKSSNAPAVVKPGDVITYTLTATNASSAVVSGAQATDDLSGVADDATVSVTSPQLSRAGNVLTWNIPTLAPGAEATVSYTAVVTADGATLTNTVTPVGAGGSCTVCSTTSYTPSWTLAKTSDPVDGSVVAPGTSVNYTLTVVNTGSVALTGAVASDDVSDLVDDATLGTLPSGLSRSGNTLTWSLPTVPVGGSVSVSYAATVDANSGGATLTNVAAPTSNGGTCLDCSTTSTTPSWTLAKASSVAEGATVAPGDVVGYTLTVTNTGPVTLHGAAVSDDLSAVLDDATLGTLPAGASVSGTTLTWLVPDVAPGASVTLDYAVTVKADASGVTLHNVATPTTAGGECDDVCSTTAYTGAWTLSKSSDAPAVVKPGDVITYTLTATNTSDGVVSGATAVDDLTDVVDDATVTATAAGLSLDDATLIWAIPTLAAGEHASVTYTATVTADGATLANTVTPKGVGGSCIVCSTTTYSPSWTLAKTSDPADGSVVNPGDTVTYTLTVTNTGPVALAGATVSDDVSDLVDDATLGSLPAGLTRSGDALTWSVPDVAVGGTATVSYTATVDELGATLTNVASPNSNGGTCLDCSTTSTTPSWTLAKSSDADGVTVAPGAVVGYTLTVTNTGPATLHGAAVSDDLSDVLDDATLGTLPTGSSVDGSTLTWLVPDVAPGVTATLDYSVTVNANATGVTLTNVAAPTSVGGECAAASACATTTFTPAWTLSKSSDAAAVVKPGDVITYTLTATNTSDGVVSGVSATDDLSDVLDDATVSATAAGLSLAGDTLTWAIPTLAAGEHASVTYTATVTGDGATLTNTVAPVGTGGSCTVCSTTSYTPSWTLAKTSDPADGSVVNPGGIITYTLTVTNTGPVALVDAVVSDDLSDVLDDATLGDLTSDLSVRGRELTWRVPTVPAGETVHVSYPVTVGVDALGVSLTNKASASTNGGSCPTDCTTTSTTPSWTLAKSSDADGATVAPGAVVGYTLTVTNTGPATLHGATVSDDLTDVLDDATLGTLPAGATVDGTTLTWLVPDVAAGATVTLGYSVTVNANATGVTLKNVASPTSVGGECASASACSTTTHTGAWTLSKSSDAPAVVKPGDVITYTLTATNTSDGVVSGVSATDDLSDVLDDASVSATAAGLSLDGSTLTWVIPTLNAGEHASVSYTATVTADGATLTNTVAPVGTGGSCTVCSTTSYTPSWTLAKTSDPVDGSVVNPGDVVTYTLTVVNTGPVTLTGATVSDDVSDLIDDATLGSLPAGLTRSGGTLTWSVPDVAAGGTATVSYTATVDELGATLTNVASPDSNGGTCLDCSTTSTTPAWTLAKTSNADGTTVAPGAVVGYTLTVTNTGPATLHGATVSDDLTDVLDDARLGTLPAGATVDGATLTWTVPDVAAGASVSLGYSVTVNANATGVTLRNTAAPTSVGGECASASACSTTTHTGAWTLSKSSDAPAVVKPGDVITYTLTATNTSDGVVSGVSATDDLSDVLDDATVTATAAGLSLDGSTLTWVIPTLNAGEHASVSYTATVTADGATLTNTVTPVGSGGACTVCSTTSYTPSWTLAKTSDPADGSVVNPGDTVAYTLTVVNTGPVTLAGATVSDDVSDLIDDATLATLPSGISRSGGTLTWSVPDVAVGGTATVSYTATVDELGATLTNVAAPASNGGTCLDCSTTSTTPSWTLAKTSDADGTTVAPGAVVRYSLTVTNTGPATLHGATVSDDLSDVLDDATLGTLPGVASVDGTTLTWTVHDVAAGSSVTLDYSVTVNANANGVTLKNTATPTSVGGECASASACSTTTHTGAWTLSKSSDAPAVVKPGDVITYTLTATNTSDGVVSGVAATDDLSDVLDDATVTATAAGLSLAGDTLTWVIPTLNAGEHATVSYTATVTADGSTLTNTVTPVGTGGSCTTCSTTSYTPSWTLAKTSDPADGSVVNPGDTVTYTLTVVNTGPIALTGVTVSDDLSDLIDDATLGNLPAGLTRSGDALTWSVPDVAVGGTATISYTATVDELGATLTNVASPNSNGGTCLDCSTTSTTPSWTLAKTSNANGTTVAPGAVVGYTLTVTNTGPATLTGATVSDDLSDVLDDATLGTLPAGASVDGTTLTWLVPDVAAGATVTLDYAVTVNAGATGATLKNTAAPTSVGGECDVCSTTTHTGAWTLSKSSDAPAVVKPGDVITYTLTATNTSDGVVSGVSATDDLSDVLDDATVKATAAGLSLDGSTLTWVIPTLNAGEHATVTYTATVTADGATLTNTVAPVGTGGACTVCSTTSYTPSWTLAKTSDPADGSVVNPGDTVTYTLTVVNIGPVALTGAEVSDDLSDLVDDATLGNLPAGLTRSGDALTWSVPDVAVGGTATVSYTATVDELGATLTNVAAPNSNGGTCLDCSTTSTTPSWRLAKTSNADGTTVAPGAVVGYTLTVTNTGPATLTGATVSDDLSDVLDDATLGALPAGASVDGTTLTWLVPDVAAGAKVTLDYSVTVNANAIGVTLKNVVAPTSVGGECDVCSTTTHTGAWTLAKSSDAPAVVKPGDVITYTLTATNTSVGVVSGVKATDDLSDVLDDATVSATAAGLSLDGSTLTWVIPSLNAGEHASVSYTATVAADGATLTNTVTPVGTGGACTTCSTTSYTPSWTLAKSSDPVDGSVVNPGDTVTYTLTVVNTGPVTLTGVTVSDDVSDLIDDATLGTLPSGISRSGGALTWSVPDVAVGGTATISYTATVDELGATLTNVAAPATNGGTCLDCSTTSTTPSWTLAKTSNADGTTVAPGAVVGYTLTVTNTGPATLTGATVSDDLSDVLDDAALGTLPAGATVDGTTLTWAVPDVAAGATVSLDYSVTVNANATGVTLKNVASPTSVGGQCADECSTTSHTGAWTLSKSSDAPAVVKPGDVITYTLTATNTSDGVVSGVSATDDLSNVLDDATVSARAAGLSLDGDTLTWVIPTLNAGEHASVSYTATVTADGATLTNTVAPVGTGGACTTCTTTSYTPSWTLAKTSDQTGNDSLQPGDTITYTLTVVNTGPIALTGAEVSDDVSDVVDDATLGDLPADLTRSAETLTWSVPTVPVGGTASVRYTAVVTASGAQLTNVASPTTNGGTCLDCSTTSWSPKWTLAKTSDVADGAVVKPGDTINYTLTVTNEGLTTLVGATVTDDLSDVLDDAELDAVPAGASIDGATLTWAVPDLAVGGTAELTYQVTLADDARGATVRNAATPASLGGECAESCTTTAYTTAWTLSKTSDPGSGATVVPGDEITYTLTVTNTGPVVLSGTQVHDNMSDLLDDATLVGALPAGATLADDQLTWDVPDVAVGGTAQVSYTVRVNAGAYGHTLGNVAYGEGAVSCAVGGPLGTDGALGDCATEHFSPAWTLSKTSTPGSGTTVVPGDDVTYTLHVRNTSRAQVRGAVVTDDLSDVLAYAALAGLPDGATLTGTVLTWAVPTLAPGEEATLVYTVTVDDDAYNATFTNTAVPGDPGGSCPDTCTAVLVTSKAVVDPTDDNDSGSNGTTSGELAFTGSDLGLLGVAGVALAVGAGLLVLGRRRSAEED